MKKGFTLIELLVVVAIISLLSSIVLATLSDARDRVRQVAFREYLGQVVSAIELNRTNSGEMPTQMFLEQLVKGNGVNWAGIESYIAYSDAPPFVERTPADHATYRNGPIIAFYQTEYTYTDLSPIPDPDLARDCGQISTNRVGGYVIAFKSTANNLNFQRLYSKTGPISGWYCISDLVR